MRNRFRPLLAWALWAFSIGALALMLAIGALTGSLSEGGPGGIAPLISTILFIVAFATVGALLGARRPSNPIGWLLLGSGLCFLGGAAAAILHEIPRFVRLGDWLGNWIWALGVAIPATFVILLFPTGTLPSRRWRPLAWLAGAALAAFLVGSFFAPGIIEDTASTNPLGISGPAGRVFAFLRPAGFIMLGPILLVAVGSLAIRFRRAGLSERQQLKWLLLAGGTGILIGLLGEPVVAAFVTPRDLAINIGNAVVSAAVALVPVAIGVAVLRHGLYDIDLVINKALVFGILGALITAVYVGVVVGIGAVLQARGNTLLTIVAAVVIALAFNPVRQRARHLANRLVYGRRATPYEVLSAFGQRVAETYAIEDVLPRMARILAEGTGATVAQVWVAAGDRLRLNAEWPGPGRGSAVDASFGDGSVDVPDASLAAAVRHQGETLGALAIRKPANDPVTPADEKLVADLASQAGLVLRNVGLIEGLRSSRRRLVEAQDAERRRIERNIHDGAQQQLVALSVQVGMARTKAADNREVQELLERVQGQLQQALEDLRDLARGVYPPLLADRGLAVALEAQARKAALPVEVLADAIGRYLQEVEAAVYFSVLEALQNTAKYAGASRATVRLSADDRTLSFDVIDDGVGFDPEQTAYGTGLQGMADRLEALGGEVSVESSPGKGTRVTGRLRVTPVQEPSRTMERELGTVQAT